MNFCLLIILITNHTNSVCFWCWEGVVQCSFLHTPENLSELFVLQKNWNLFSVNIAMAGTGIYQLSRKLRYGVFFILVLDDFSSPRPRVRGF